MSDVQLDLLRHQLAAREQEVRRLEAELDAAREEREELFEFAPVGYLTLGRSGVILEANLTAAALLGEPRASLIGKAISAYVAPAHAFDLDAELRAALSGEARGAIEVEGRSGKFLRFESVSFSEGGAFSECRTVISDVTEQRVAAGASDREARMAAVLAAVIDGQVRIDSSGTIVAFTRAAEGLFSREAKDLIGRNVSALLSEEGRGKIASVAELPAAAVQPPLRGTILLIEDEAGAREALAGLLRGSGYAVLAAADGSEAIARSRASGCEVDVVLMDLMLPDAQGHQLAVNLHGRCAGAPVVYMSGRSRERALEEGVVPPNAPYLEKPIDFGQLERVLEHALRAS